MPRDVFVFDEFLFDARSEELWKHGQPQRLHPQPAQLLHLLLQNAGELVTREAIHDVLWGHDVHVDVDVGINACVKRLRTALGDDADDPRFIKTVPRKGYRFTASVAAPETPGAYAARRYVGFAAVATAAAGVLVLAASFLLPRRASVVNLRPLTSYVGVETYPAFSPDGARLAFAWRRETGAGSHVYAKLVNGGEPLQLTDGAVFDCCPAWSPDGTAIAFVRHVETGGEYEILSVPALGGAERRLATSSASAVPRISWMPDGTSMVFTDRIKDQEHDVVVSLSLDTGEKRSLTSLSDSEEPHDRFPAISPDGRVLVFFRGARNQGSIGELWRKDLVHGDEALLVSRGLPIYGLDWSPDGENIVFSSPRAHSYETGLWRVPASGGEPVDLGLGENARQLSVCPSGRCVAYSRSERDYNLWRVPVSDAGAHETPVRLLGSTRDEIYASYSPDGSRIAFVSDRDGTWELRVAEADGANERTLVDGTHYIGPSWSPDGTQIAFHTALGDEAEPSVYVVSAGGGVPRAVSGASPGAVARWSADAQTLFFQSRRSGRLQIWKVPVGGGEAVALTKEGGALPYDVIGERLYYMHEDGFRLWSVSIGGGDERPAANERLRRAGSHTTMWSIWRDELVFLGSGPNGEPAFEAFAPSTGTRRLLVVLPADARPTRGISVSPDGRWILYAQNDDLGSDLVLLEGFR